MGMTFAIMSHDNTQIDAPERLNSRVYLLSGCVNRSFPKQMSTYIAIKFKSHYIIHIHIITAKTGLCEVDDRGVY